jgi:hypothetical protein
MAESSYKLRKGVLIIEDMHDDYNHISNIFKEYGWKVFPGTDDYKSKWIRMYLDYAPSEISGFIREYLQEKYREISVICLDIWLIKSDNRDQTGIDKVLPMIRHLDTGDEEFDRWGEKVPIIVVTQIPSREINRTASLERDFVDAFFRKDRFQIEPHLLVITSQSLLNVFRLFLMGLNGGLDGIINDEIKAVFEYLEKDKKAVISKIEDIEIILKGGLDSVEARLRLILNALFVQMKDEEKKKIMQQFSQELKNALGSEHLKKIEQEFEKPSLKEDFKKCIKKGTMAEFATFLTNVYDELVKTGILSEIPLVKFIGMGLTTILKIMSK